MEAASPRGHGVFSTDLPGQDSPVLGRVPGWCEPATAGGWAVPAAPHRLSVCLSHLRCFLPCSHCHWGGVGRGVWPDWPSRASPFRPTSRESICRAGPSPACKAVLLITAVNWRAACFFLRQCLAVIRATWSCSQPWAQAGRGQRSISVTRGTSVPVPIPGEDGCWGGELCQERGRRGRGPSWGWTHRCRPQQTLLAPVCTQTVPNTQAVCRPGAGPDTRGDFHCQATHLC